MLLTLDVRFTSLAARNVGRRNLTLLVNALNLVSESLLSRVPVPPPS